MKGDLILWALDLPDSTRVDQRVPKKLLLENGATTASDKRLINDGVDELLWLAALKPTTIGVPAYRDEVREYLEIAVLRLRLRGGAKATRLVELVHRAVPYPVILITSDTSGIALSVAHKRHAQNEVGKVVIERVVSVGSLRADGLGGQQEAFANSLALGRQPSQDLFRLYEGWLARIEALNAARLAGSYVATDDAAAVERRRAALEEHSRLSREVVQLRLQAARAKQIRDRVDLNQKIKAIEVAITTSKKLMLGGDA